MTPERLPGRAPTGVTAGGFAFWNGWRFMGRVRFPALVLVLVLVLVLGSRGSRAGGRGVEQRGRVTSTLGGAGYHVCPAASMWSAELWRALRTRRRANGFAAAASSRSVV